MSKILCAVAPDAEERIRRILPADLLLFAETLQAAEDALEKDRIALIVVGARFDESRMFDLLDYLRKHAEHKKIPIVAAVIGLTTMSRETLQGLAHATKIFGASVFVNLNDFADDETENARLRLVMHALILPPSLIPVVAAKVGLQQSQ